jgi:predicted sulfurtransferase
MAAKADRYFKAKCPKCGKMQVFDKRKECQDDDVSIMLSPDQSVVWVLCQNPACRHKFKVEIDCTGYTLK